MKSNFTTKLFRFNIALAFVEGVFVLWQYIKTPSESGAAVFMGFSLLRLATLFGVVLVLLAAGYLLFLSSRASWWERTPGTVVTRIFERTELFWFLLLVFSSLYVFIFSSEHYLGGLALHRASLNPVLTWFGLTTLQGLISFLCLRAYDFPVFQKYRNVLLPSGAAFILMGVLISFIAFTRVGLTPDAVYWQEAGVPLLFPQILSIGMMGFLTHRLLSGINASRPHNKRTNALIFIALWLIAFVLWQSQTAHPAYNSLEPVAPNFQSYPFGDAMLYDVTAQNFVIGKPIPADFWAKPLYSFFLAMLHQIAGQDFSLIITLQVAFLALIPSLIFSLTQILGGRLSGIVAALLVILRERNSIALSNIIQVSHSKLLLSDVFAMGGMIVLVWLVLWWLEQPSTRRAIPIAIGGAMGLLILMRGHPVLIVPFLFLIGFISLHKDMRLWLESSLKIVIGMSLIMLPWFWHTYDLTGKFAFQDNSSPFATRDAFVQVYAPTSSTDSSSYGQFESQVLQQALEHPMEVIQFVSAHYFHNTIFSYVFLPQSFQIESLRSYVKRLPFWGNWDGSLSVEATLLILANFSILALGLGAAWKKTKGLIFVPLVMGAAYNLSVAVSRRSGWRFILPADWVTLVFYAIGIAQFIVMVYAIVRPSVDEQTDLAETADEIPVWGRMQRSPVLMGLPFLLIAVPLVVGHKFIPLRYPSKNASEIVQVYRSTSQGLAGLDSAAVEDFMQQENAIAVYGRALYPIHFKSNAGALNYSWLSFSPKPYKRLVFYVIGPEPVGVIFPVESLPSNFPDGADVIVIGCKTKSGDIQALSIAILSDPPILYDREPVPQLTCPLPEPN